MTVRTIFSNPVAVVVARAVIVELFLVGSNVLGAVYKGSCTTQMQVVQSCELGPSIAIEVVGTPSLGGSSVTRIGVVFAEVGVTSDEVGAASEVIGAASIGGSSVTGVGVVSDEVGPASEVIGVASFGGSSVTGIVEQLVVNASNRHNQYSRLRPNCRHMRSSLFFSTLNNNCS